MKASVLFTLGLVVVSPLCALGAGMRIYQQDAAAVAQGNAFTATADNPSTIYYNPAGISQLEGHNFRSGLGLFYLREQYEDPSGREWSTVDRLRAAAQMYYTYSAQTVPLSLGLGLYAPYGLGIEWPDNSPLRSLITRADLLYLTFNPVLAWKLGPKLSLAAGPTFNYADLDLRQGMVVPGDRSRFRGDGFTPGFNAGLLWRVQERHTFGLNYRSATTVDFAGHTDVRNLTPLMPGVPPSGRSAANMEVPFPQHITAGWSYRPGPVWNLEFDVGWTGWSRLSTTTLNLPGGGVPLSFNWRSSYNLAWGATHYFKNGYSLSAGYKLDQSQIPNARDFKPNNYDQPDAWGHIFMLGLGRQGKRWGANMAYQAMWGPPGTVSGSAPSPTGQSADGRYENLSHGLMLSVGRRF